MPVSTAVSYGSGARVTSCLVPLTSNFRHRSPEDFTFENVQADTPQLVDVRMIYLGEKSDFGWGHRIIIGEEEFEFEDTR